VFSVQIFQENTFLETKPNFSLTGKCFPLTNSSNSKQTQKNFKNNFSKSEIQKTNKTDEYAMIFENSKGNLTIYVNQFTILYLFLIILPLYS
jgi:ABC-type enterochelin transport system substrate-binding protein